MNTPYTAHDGQLLEQPDDELWIRSSDNVQRTADDILSDLTTREYLDLACIGAASVNQAIKALAVAREKLGGHDDLVAQPYFSTITDDRERERTRMVIRVSRARGHSPYKRK